MTRLAMYARQSDDKQNPLSPEDQLARCHELAHRHGFSTDHVLIFIDEALSATGKHDHKRIQFQRLLEAWDANQFDVLLVDEWSRLTREGVAHAKLVKRLEDNRRVRLITGNGLDTNQPNWQLVAGLFGMVGQQSTRDTQFRVARGMLGQLRRGFMIASPAFGYDIRHEHDETGRSIGAKWVSNEAQAEVVKEIFARRERGQSMHQIARWLNEIQMPTSRKPRKNSGGFWRPSRIRNLLQNPVYRGEFHWHGSANYQKMAEKKGVEKKIQVFARPELRLVSDETWHRCNAKDGVSRSGYGGGKHALAGLFTCGYCHGILAISGTKRAPSLSCPSCAVAKSAAGKTERLTVTVATVGAELLLKEALQHFLTPAFVEAFRASLRQRLAGDNRQGIGCAEDEVARLRRQQERISRILATSDDDDPVLAERYEEVRSAVRKAQDDLDKLLEGSVPVDTKAIEAQLNVDPAEMLEHLFVPSEVAPEHLRALLGRLFPSIVLEGKEGRYTSTFRIRFATGVALSMVSKTSVVDEATNEMRFELRYTPDNRTGRTQRWSVRPLATSPMAHQGQSALLGYFSAAGMWCDSSLAEMKSSAAFA